MGDLDDKWLEVFNALLVEAKKVAGLDDTNTFQGLDRAPIGDVMVLLGGADITPRGRDTGGTYYQMDFIFLVVVDESDLVAGLKETFDWAGLIWEEIKDDRTLGGIIENVEDPGYRPNGLSSLPGFERQHLVMTVQAFVWVDD